MAIKISVTLSQKQLYPSETIILASKSLAKLYFLKYILPNLWGYSSVGRAMRSQCIGQGFESPYLHK